jgi:phosphate transport system substrate-binding protein
LEIRGVFELKILGLAGLAMSLAAGIASDAALARDRILIVGSSTVYPFASAVAEQFGRSSGFKTPVVESTGSGGGIRLFCAGADEKTPDITNASRRMKPAELAKCHENGVTPAEVVIGYDGIVLANSVDGPKFHLTLEQIFRGLAKELPIDGELVMNPHRNWSDIDPSLPNEKIEVLGPPPTSGTRDAFEELVMETACAMIGNIPDESCTAIREDGFFVEAGENDNLIVSKLAANPVAVGIFGYSFLDQNPAKIQGAAVGGVEPTFENIAAGRYPVSRSLYFYVKKEHVNEVPGIREYIAEFTSDSAWGDDGYLTKIGLIPLPIEARNDGEKAARDLLPLRM